MGLLDYDGLLCTVGDCYFDHCLCTMRSSTLPLESGLFVDGLDPPDSGTCPRTRPSQVPSALSNCIAHLMLVLLPFPVLFRLQMSLGRKSDLMFIF